MIIDYLTESYSNKLIRELAYNIVTINDNNSEFDDSNIKDIASMYLALIMFKNKDVSVKPDTIKKALKKYNIKYNGEDIDDKHGARFIGFGKIGQGVDAMFIPNTRSHGKYNVYGVGGVGQHGKALIEALRQIISTDPKVIKKATEIANFIKIEDQTNIQTINTIASPKTDAKGREIKTKSGHSVPEFKTLATYEINPEKELARLSKEIQELN